MAAGAQIHLTGINCETNLTPIDPFDEYIMTVELEFNQVLFPIQNAITTLTTYRHSHQKQLSLNHQRPGLHLIESRLEKVIINVMRTSARPPLTETKGHQPPTGETEKSFKRNYKSN